MRLGVISALHEEQQGLIEAMEGTTTVNHGMREYTEGQLWGIDAVCVLSRIGKVAAAMTTTMLIERFGVTHILFTGVAGAGHAGVQVGDVVIAESLVQYDMDASPLFPRHQVPLTGISHFQTDLVLTDRLAEAVDIFLANDFALALDVHEQQVFKLEKAHAHRGLIASGDCFINDKERINGLAGALPGLLAVEMEGAAVAQVCFELGVPFAILRTISDNANEEAATDFMRFVKKVASTYTFCIIRQFCNLHSTG
jgi:adenosylhomocysteine nucleosidase